jgi:transcriptional regulator with XRE-family HTH domain
MPLIGSTLIRVVSDSAATADFARKFRLALEALNWSRARCARELRVDKSDVSRWTSGVSPPSEHNLTLFTEAIRQAYPNFPLGAWRLSVADFAARLNAVPVRRIRWSR